MAPRSPPGDGERTSTNQQPVSESPSNKSMVPSAVDKSGLSNRSVSEKDRPPSFSAESSSSSPSNENEANDVAKSNEGYTARSMIGQTMTAFSDFMNEHIVAARYVTITSVALLTAYGISKTPFFYRYKNVSDIPASCFKKRKTIHGRLVGLAPTQGTKGGDFRPLETGDSSKITEREVPIVCYVYHLSPMGRLLNRTAFDFFVKNSPSSSTRLGRSGRNDDDVRLENRRDLLRVEIAGIKAPPPYHAPQHLEQEGEWLQKLAANRTSVACQLLARRISRPPTIKERTKAVTTTASHDTELKNVQLHHRHDNDYNDELDQEQVAICRIKYKQPGINFFRTDLATSLVSSGRAAVSTGIHVEDPKKPTMDGSTSVKDLQSDASYLEQLGKAEYDAFKKSAGMWVDDNVRGMRKDLMDEASFDATAGPFRKFWRWIWS